MQEENSAQSVTTRELTFGEKAVGLTFNPSGDEKVNEVKKLYAAIIDLCNEIRNDERSEKAALLTIAIRSAQTAQMAAVKGITWKD